MRRSISLIILAIFLASTLLYLGHYYLSHKRFNHDIESIASATWTYVQQGEEITRPIRLGTGLPNANKDLEDCCRGTYRFVIGSEILNRVRKNSSTEVNGSTALYFPAIGGDFTIKINGKRVEHIEFDASSIGPLIPLSQEFLQRQSDLPVEVIMAGTKNGFAGIWRGPVLVSDFGVLDQKRHRDFIFQVLTPVIIGIVTAILAAVFGYLYFVTERQFSSYGLLALSLIPISIFQFVLSGIPRTINFWFGATVHYPARLLEGLGIYLLLVCFSAHLNEESDMHAAKERCAFLTISRILGGGAMVLILAGPFSIWVGQNAVTAILFPLAFYPILSWRLQNASIRSLSFVGFLIAMTAALGSILDGAKLVCRVFGVIVPYEYFNRLTTPLIVGSTVLIFATHFRRFYQNHLKALAIAARDAAVASTMQMVAHDIRKPFSLLRGALHVTLHQDLPEKTMLRMQKAGDEVRQALRAVDAMVDDMMSVSSEPKLRIEAVNTTVLISEALVMLSKNESTAAVQVKRDSNFEININVDRHKIVRVLTNLIDNALHAAAGQLVWVETRIACGGNEVEVMVGNKGSFINDADRTKIFESFFTKGKVDGTGLGLAIAKKIIEAHGGTIDCESSITEGTCFRILLPSNITLTNERLIKHISIDSTEIAVVDDDPFILEASVYRFKNFDVHTFYSPADFWLTFKTGGLERLAFVVTDYVFSEQMDSENGAAFADSIKKVRPELPVFLCSDFPLSQDDEKVFTGRLSKIAEANEDIPAMLGFAMQGKYVGTRSSD